MVGVSSEFMHLILKDLDLAIERVAEWKLEIERTMTLLGSQSIQDLQNTDIIISGETAHWAELRGIDLKKYANRRK